MEIKNQELRIRASIKVLALFLLSFCELFERGMSSSSSLAIYHLIMEKRYFFDGFSIDFMREERDLLLRKRLREYSYLVEAYQGEENGPFEARVIRIRERELDQIKVYRESEELPWVTIVKEIARFCGVRDLSSLERRQQVTKVVLIKGRIEKFAKIGPNDVQGHIRFFQNDPYWGP